MDELEDQSDEHFDEALFDVSDVEFEVLPSKKRTEVVIRLSSETDFCLMKFYCALDFYLEKMRREMNIMEQSEGTH